MGDRHGEAIVLNNIAEIMNTKDDSEGALTHLKLSLDINRQIGARKSESITLSNLGQFYKERLEYDTALYYLEQSLVIRQQIGDHKAEGTTLNNLAEIICIKGDYDTALRYLEQSLSIQKQIGDFTNFAATLNNMGAIFWDQKNDVENAVRAFGQSYQIFKKMGLPDIRHPESYLSKIIAHIGEARVLEIIQTLPALQEKGSAQERPQ